MKPIKVKGRVLNIRINGENNRVEEENDALVELAAVDIKSLKKGDLVLAVLEYKEDESFKGVPAAGIYKVEKDICIPTGMDRQRKMPTGN